MRWITGMTAVLMAASLGMASGTGARDDGDWRESHSRRGCSAATLRGTFGIQMQGTRPAAPGGPIEAVNGVVLRQYDGDGQFSQVDNVKGSLTGITPDRPGFGTYEVNEDCTGVTHFQPAPGVVVDERFVIVAGGSEVLSIVATPAPIMIATVQKRVSDR